MESKEDVFKDLLENFAHYYSEYIAEHGDPSKAHDLIEHDMNIYRDRWKNAK